MPLLLLILNKPPPVLIQGHGRQSLSDAIITGLPQVISQADAVAPWKEKIDETVAWVTWHQIADAVRGRLEVTNPADVSVAASIRRLVDSITSSIAWHDEVRKKPAETNE